MRGAPDFTPDQLAAVEDRRGPALLAANAGSGKTSVMVERFVEAVLLDGVGVGAILALTFTEKAAGELRDRIRRRFAALGEDERAREAEGAWIGTIHGFCARVLRAHPFGAGLDPRFAVLDEAAARRTAWAAYDRAALFVLPSHFEPWGHVILEAMGRGVPCVGVDRFGMPDMIRPGETGVLIQPGAEAELAEALIGLLGNPESAERLGRAAYASVREQHTWADVVARMRPALEASISRP